MSLLDEVGLELPVVQAGMGGGVAGGELAGTVSAAGALGTVGIMAPRAFHAALRQARRMAPGRPVAANLLVPFIKRAHVDACAEAGAALVVLLGGPAPGWVAQLRARGLRVAQTVGTAAEARRALAEGADALVAQGTEAGGHLMASESLDRALPEVLEAAGGAPVLAAAGIAEAADVRRVLDQGATAAVAGTRFLLTPESGAHPLYRQRVLAAPRTLATLLFGFGWPLRHRVIPNALTERWCRDDDLGPSWVRRAGELSAPLGGLLPLGALGTLIAMQHPAVPLYSPALPLKSMPDRAVDRGALYAGETLHRLDDVIGAAEAVARLTP